MGKEAKLYHNVGNSLLKSQKIKESIGAYKEALNLNPNDQETKYNLSYALNMLKNPDQNQQQKDQNKDQNQDQNKDQQKQDQQQNQDQQKQDQQQKEQQQQSQEQKEQELTKHEAEKILEALKNNEKDLQKQLRKIKGDLFRCVHALENAMLKLPDVQNGLGIAGGAPGLNAALEWDPRSGYVIIVLANFDPPAAGRVAQYIRKTLPVDRS